MLRRYLAWPVVTATASDVLRAAEVSQRHRLSLWDALIVVAAARSGASHLLTEDLNPGQILEGVRVHNPLSPRDGPGPDDLSPVI